MKTKLKFVATVWKEGKYFVAQCLNVDVSSFGKTRSEALRNLNEALELYFDDRPKRMPKVALPSVVTQELEYA